MHQNNNLEIMNEIESRFQQIKLSIVQYEAYLEEERLEPKIAIREIEKSISDFVEEFVNPLVLESMFIDLFMQDIITTNDPDNINANDHIMEITEKAKLHKRTADELQTIIESSHPLSVRFQRALLNQIVVQRKMEKLVEQYQALQNELGAKVITLENELPDIQEFQDAVKSIKQFAGINYPLKDLWIDFKFRIYKIISFVAGLLIALLIDHAVPFVETFLSFSFPKDVHVVSIVIVFGIQVLLFDKQLEKIKRNFMWRNFGDFCKMFKSNLQECIRLRTQLEGFKQRRLDLKNYIEHRMQK